MVRMRETIESFNVVGLPLRTSNREAVRTIPPHWRAAADVGLLDPEKPGVGPGIYAIYTDYETPGDDVDGVYIHVIDRVPTQDAAQAVAAVRAGTTTGKIVLAHVQD